MAEFQRIGDGPGGDGASPGEGGILSWATRVVRSMCCGTVTVGPRVILVGRLLGEGGYAFVHEATDTETGEHLALKRIVCQTADQLDAAQHEVRLHQRLGSHPHLMPLIASAVVPSRVGGGAQDVLMLMPLARGGTLADAIRAKAAVGAHISERQVLSTLAQTASALAHLHGAGGVSHRDVKPANVLLDVGSAPAPPSSAVADWEDRLPTITLIDYGSAGPAAVRCCSRSDALRLQDEASRQCSMAYRAPELWEPPSDGGGSNGNGRGAAGGSAGDGGGSVGVLASEPAARGSDAADDDDFNPFAG
ncbi:hypothetical protein FNF27_05743 [Cafeteria roenbergensis]|uniref:non-specific serine/threonine protein kinase n=2 Tax=Cafeteria roenbergensis TaxID=33653 RepID=A0A5A8E4Y3_CAFRO|nr:hypothetical protein FNF27_05743 [Cafeteria roenbergensis]